MAIGENQLTVEAAPLTSDLLQKFGETMSRVRAGADYKKNPMKAVQELDALIKTLDESRKNIAQQIRDLKKTNPQDTLKLTDLREQRDQLKAASTEATELRKGSFDAIGKNAGDAKADETMQAGADIFGSALKGLAVNAENGAPEDLKTILAKNPTEIFDQWATYHEHPESGKILDSVLSKLTYAQTGQLLASHPQVLKDFGPDIAPPLQKWISGRIGVTPDATQTMMEQIISPLISVVDKNVIRELVKDVGNDMNQDLVKNNPLFVTKNSLLVNAVASTEGLHFDTLVAAMDVLRKTNPSEVLRLFEEGYSAEWLLSKSARDAILANGFIGCAMTGNTAEIMNHADLLKTSPEAAKLFLDYAAATNVDIIIDLYKKDLTLPARAALPEVVNSLATHDAAKLFSVVELVMAHEGIPATQELFSGVGDAVIQTLFDQDSNNILLHFPAIQALASHPEEATRILTSCAEAAMVEKFMHALNEGHYAEWGLNEEQLNQVMTIFARSHVESPGAVIAVLQKFPIDISGFLEPFGLSLSQKDPLMFIEMYKLNPHWGQNEAIQKEYTIVKALIERVWDLKRTNYSEDADGRSVMSQKQFSMNFLSDPALREVVPKIEPNWIPELAQKGPEERASIYSYIARNLFTNNIEPTAESVRAEYEAIMEMRAEIGDTPLFQGRSVVIGSNLELKADGTPLFGPQSLVDAINNQLLPTDPRVENVRAEKDTPEELQKAKDRIKLLYITSKPPLTFMVDGHGSPDAVYFAKGENNTWKPGEDAALKITYKEMADMVVARHAYWREAMQTDILIFSSCFSQNFMRSMYTELNSKDVAPPISMGMSEYKEVGFSNFENKFGSDYHDKVLRVNSAKSTIKDSWNNDNATLTMNPTVIAPRKKTGKPIQLGENKVQRDGLPA